MEPLPPDRPRRGAPEFEALRHALREMAAALEQGRAREIEAERLRAFRETARRVAHEMRNPLTPIRLAVAQLARSSAGSQREAIDVLVAESDRLEQLAREFTEFGRLPEGPAAPIDLAELLTDLARSSVPPTMQVRLAIDDGLPPMLGHYDPLRRAFGNVLRNAVEASRADGAIELTARAEDGGVRVEIRDHGAGVPPDLAGQIFDPVRDGQERRHRPGPRPGTADGRDAPGHHRDGADARRRGHVRRADARPVTARAQILLVDDEANIRRMLGALLREEGFSVAEAAERQRRPAPGGRRGPGRGPARPHDAAGAGRAGNARQPARAGPPDARHHDERQGPAHRRRAGGQAGRVPVPGEAARTRVGAGDGARGPGAQPHPGGEPRPPRGARPALGAGGRKRRHAAGPLADRAGGADRGARAPDRRERHRQGAGRRRGARREPAGRPRVRDRELRRHPPRPGRVRDVRSRARRVHRRHRAPPRTVRAGAHRHALPRRGRRPERRCAGQAAADARDRRALAARRGDDAAGGRPHRRGHQPAPGGRGRRGRVPRGSLLPAQRLSDPPAGAARAPRGPAGAGGASGRAHSTAPGAPVHPVGPRGAGDLRLARQRPRAGQPGRAARSS